MRSGKLFSTALAVSPKHRRPRLVVRRWAVWNERGQLLREVPRPEEGDLDAGTNIIWAADTPATKKTSASIGHGVGKTSFCRLLRFGLGDELPADLRNRFVRVFGDGRLALSVEVDGKTFMVVRSIQSPAHALVTDQIDFSEVPKLDLKSRAALATLRERLSACFPEADVDTWPRVLPTVTRDQDARRDVATWREPSTGKKETRSAELLLGMGLYSKNVGESEEIERQRKHAADAAEKAVTEEAAQLEQRALWNAARLRRQLGLAKIAEDDNAIAGAERVAGAAKAIVGETEAPPGLIWLRDSAAALHQRIRATDQSLSQAEAQLAYFKSLLDVHDESRRQLEAAESKFQRASQTKPTVCVACEQPLTSAAAEAKHQSHAQEELASVRRNLADLDVKRSAASVSRDNWASKLCDTKTLLTGLEAEGRAADAQLADAEAAYQQALGVARLVEREASDLVRLIKRPPRTPKKKERRSKAASGMEADVLRRRNLLQQKYDAILRDLLGDEAHAEISFAGNVINSSLDLDGPIGGTALQVLSVRAFDIAAMLLRAEGHVPGPAFLVHDSPRDGDMSPVLYERYFRLLLKLEELGGPCFQMFVTTTTPPPEEPSQVRERIRLTLRGAPEERLFGRAL